MEVPAKGGQAKPVNKKCYVRKGVEIYSAGHTSELFWAGDSALEVSYYVFLLIKRFIWSSGFCFNKPSSLLLLGLGAI